MRYVGSRVGSSLSSCLVVKQGGQCALVPETSLHRGQLRGGKTQGLWGTEVPGAPTVGSLQHAYALCLL
jgi:hypothetical protein